ncbi:MAG: DUF2804 domain-containing protein [Spirochaetes bacterium]|nr:DUF2804 domain-containing protein [Spirochaetota bacterium]
MQQHQILDSGTLLDGQGSLREPGWATSLLLQYDRRAIRAPALSIKEWDYYCVSNGRRVLAFTIADNAYLGMLSVSLIDLEQGWQISQTLMNAFPMGRTGLPASSARGLSRIGIKDAVLQVDSLGNGRRQLQARLPSFGKGSWGLSGIQRLGRAEDLLGGIGLEVDIQLAEQPQGESMVIATPFAAAPRAFYYNQKINCQTAAGSFRAGQRSEQLNPADDMAVLDWGRGVWTYSNTWYWASASHFLGPQRIPFGFNLGTGFGDTSAASENMIFYGGKAHKFGYVHFDLNHNDFMQPWRVHSDNGRFDLTMTPQLDRAAETNLLLLASLQHQVFGRWSGYALLDDGTRLEVRDFPGFAEKVVNRW